MDIKKIWGFILDYLLPSPRKVRELEEMRPEALRELAELRFVDMPHPSLAILTYKNSYARTAIWELKYRGNRRITTLLASLLYEEIVTYLYEQGLSNLSEKPILIPIPLSNKRLRERGFNQCVLLAQELSVIDSGSCFIVHTDILKKVHETESQTKKNRAERLKNLAGCFLVPRSETLRDKHVILIDDVTTTGATFAEASKILKNAGVRKVTCIALAH